MDSLIFELQIVFYSQLFLSANVRHSMDQCKDHVHKRVKINEILLPRFGDITTG